MSSEATVTTSRKTKVAALVLGIPACIVVFFVYSGYHKSIDFRTWLAAQDQYRDNETPTALGNFDSIYPKEKSSPPPISNTSSTDKPDNSTNNFQKRENVTNVPVPPLPTLSPYCRALLAEDNKTPRRKKSSKKAPSQKVSSSAEFAKKIRILCWLTTSPQYAQTRLPHVKSTWGPRCDKTLYFSSFEDEDFPIVKLNATEGHAFLWGKTKAAFKYVYEHHFDEFDWFFKADDDTYLIIENLRFLLSQFDTQQPVFLGHSLYNTALNTTFASGGAGYALSKAALQRFVECGINESTKCSQLEVGREDVELARCLKKLGVKHVDSRDPLGRQRFIPFDPWKYMTGHVAPWYYGATNYPYRERK
ncbi:glycoprotein-N-acetylgalactosamine 3-beta-galactosyltransferase 1-like isoform X2 [Ptychodera flava]|uniref:glycoprotein-N-acetylgalactosamine 3-beta-galactosyltransferase 1-like isoform X2 n=1 Tax=Ptychodera flava TaxID=63121 RepID=UPI00396A2870